MGSEIERYLGYFERNLRTKYPDLKHHDVIKDNYIDVMIRFNKKRVVFKILSIIGYLFMYLLIFIIIAVPYLLMFLQFITAEDVEKISAYIQTGIGIVLSIFKIIYDKIGFSRKIFIYEQTITHLKQEGVKFLNKDHDDKYNEYDTSQDKFVKFVHEINTIINLAIIKHTLEDHEMADHQPYHFNSMGSDFFNITPIVLHEEEQEEKQKTSSDEESLSLNDVVIQTIQY